MIPSLKPVPNMRCFIVKPGLEVKAPSKYLIEDWDFNNKIKCRITEDHERLVERISEESKRVIDETTEITKSWQNDVEHEMKERVSEIEFLVEELKKQKKTAVLENEALTTYQKRVNKVIDYLRDKTLPICKQCIVWRESRIGVDNCNDEVHHQLSRELKVIKGCQDLMDKTAKETSEQIRKLRAATILLDLDVEQKDKSLLIDKANIRLKQFHHNLGEGVDLSARHCLYSLVEWSQQTFKNLETNAKELASTSALRSYIDLILNQVCEDLRNQTERTNEAFEHRIREVKSVKKTLEEKHHNIMSHVMDTKQTIQVLQNEIADKERSMLLCKTRLANRARRPGFELTCDLVQDTLYLELSALQATMCKLKQKVDENKALLRYLLNVQIQLAEEINVKANDIKIDEVDCGALREALVYTNF